MQFPLKRRFRREEKPSVVCRRVVSGYDFRSTNLESRGGPTSDLRAQRMFETGVGSYPWECQLRAPAEGVIVLPVAYAFIALALALLLVRTNCCAHGPVRRVSSTQILPAVSDLRSVYRLDGFEIDHTAGDELRTVYLRQ